MALADYDAYVAALRLNHSADWQLSGNTGVQARMVAHWPVFVPAPTTPTTSVALNSSSAESIGPIPLTSSGLITLLGARLNSSSIGGAGLLVLDLLNISGGLDVTVDPGVEKTTNLPTAALTRHTTGAGVMAALICHTQNGSTATTVTMKYTNQSNTSGQISPAHAFGGTGYREVRRLIVMPLAAGDTGVRSVESVTFAATTGSNASVGVVLFKPLMMLSLDSTTGTSPLDAVSTGGIINAFAQADDDACISLAGMTVVAQTVNGSLLVGET